MFWGLILESGKRYAQTVKNSFHVSMATLDLTHPGANDAQVTVLVEHGGHDFIVCTLSKGKCTQQYIDLNFETDERVAFFSQGAKMPVHLTGYLIPEETVMEEEMEEEESEEDVRTITEKRKASNSDPDLSKKQKITEVLAKLKANRSINSTFADEDDSEDDDDSDLEDSSAVLVDDSDESDGEELDSDEDDIPKKKAPVKFVPTTIQSKLNNFNKAAVAALIPGPKTPNNQGPKTPNNQGPKTPTLKTPNFQGPKTQVPTPGTASSTGTEGESAKKKKKNKKKNKNKGQINDSASETQDPETPRKICLDLFRPSIVSGKTRVLKGGVTIQELKEGSGPEAKLGRFVSVYYTGTLQQNHKQFDSSTQGPGFKFKLGQGEVIKGWDVGVPGMKVGGKRRIVIPSPLGYGKTGMPPAIPPNSNLIFDVELKSVN